MGKISWKQNMKNEMVLKKLKTEKTFLNTIKAGKLKFFGHTERHDSILNKKQQTFNPRRQGGGQKTTRQVSRLSAATTSRSGQDTV